jgi:acyl carrier protein
MSSTIERLRKIINTAIKKDIQIGVDEPLEHVVTSSLTFVIILGEIEREFDLEIPEDQLDLENFKTLNTINNLINHLHKVAS